MPPQPLTALLFASIVTVEARGKEVRVLLKRMIFVLVVVALVMTMPMMSAAGATVKQTAVTD
jgi:hypothetical protein